MSVESLPEFQAAVWIWRTFPPLFIVVGAIGNALSLCVLLLSRSFQASTVVLLASLAVVDLVVLVVPLPRQWMQYALEADIRTVHPTLCKVHVFVTYASIQLSSWILMTITLERTLSILCPHKVRILCTKGRAVCLVLVLTGGILLLNFHFILGFETTYHSDRNITTCQPKTQHADFFYRVWPWVDLVVGFLLPFVVLFCGNLYIVRTIWFNRIVETTRPRTGDHVELRRSSSGSNRNTNTSGSNLVLKLMVGLNVCYLLCVSPITVFMIGQVFWWPSGQPPTAQDNAELELTWCIVNVFMYTNNTINFLLYIVCGGRFRRELRRLFCRRRAGQFHPAGRRQRPGSGKSRTSSNRRSGTSPGTDQTTLR